MNNSGNSVVPNQPGHLLGGMRAWGGEVDGEEGGKEQREKEEGREEGKRQDKTGSQEQKKQRESSLYFYLSPLEFFQWELTDSALLFFANSRYTFSLRLVVCKTGETKQSPS